MKKQKKNYTEEQYAAYSDQHATCPKCKTHAPMEEMSYYKKDRRFAHRDCSVVSEEERTKRNKNSHSWHVHRCESRCESCGTFHMPRSLKISPDQEKTYCRLCYFIIVNGLEKEAEVHIHLMQEANQTKEGKKRIKAKEKREKEILENCSRIMREEELARETIAAG